MTNITFVLWICLFPLCTTIGRYFTAKKKAIFKEPDYSPEVKNITAFVELAIWVGVSAVLYR